MARHDQPEWRDRMRLRFDFNNAMADAIGTERGVTEDAVNGLAQRVRQGHESLRRRRQAGDLNWADLPYAQDVVRDVLGYVDSVAGRFDHVVVLGAGGSTLGNVALASALNHPYHNLLPPSQRQGRPRLFILEGLDPDQFAGLFQVIDLDRTLFALSCRAGSGMATAQLSVLRRLLSDRVGRSHVDRIVCAVDVRDDELRKTLQADGMRSFDVPPGGAGRFAVLSAAGLLPAAITGVDVTGLLAGAAFADQLGNEPDVWRNAAYMNAAVHHLVRQGGQTASAMVPRNHALRGVPTWYGQSVITRTGRELVTFLAVESFKHELPVAGAVPEAPIPTGPSVTFTLPEVNPFTFGQLLFTLELQAAMLIELAGRPAQDAPRPDDDTRKFSPKYVI